MFLDYLCHESKIALSESFSEINILIINKKSL